MDMNNSNPESETKSPSKLILGPSVTDDRAPYERLAEVELAKHEPKPDFEVLQEAWNVLKDELPAGIEFEVKDRDRFTKAYLKIEEILGELGPGVRYVRPS